MAHPARLAYLGILLLSLTPARAGGDEADGGRPAWEVDPVPVPGPTGEPAAPAEAAEPAAPAVKPPPLVLGKSTLEQAEAYWSAIGAEEDGRGTLAIGWGSGKDGLGKFGLSQVVLVDVDGVDFEGFTRARYGFVDGVLFSVQVNLEKYYPVGLGAPERIDREDWNAVVKRLHARHGKPTRTQRDWAASGKRPNVFVWVKGKNQLVLANSLHVFVAHENVALRKKVDAYHKAECRKRKNPDCW